MPTQFMKNNIRALCLILASVLLTSALSGCSLFSKNPVSGSDVSGGDVSPSALSGGDVTAVSGADTEEYVYFPMYQSIPAEWPPAEDDAGYMAALRVRLDEYIQLLAALGGILRNLPDRCQTASQVRADGAFLPFSGAAAQWIKLVESYPTEALDDAAADAHGRLLELAKTTREYLAAIPAMVESGDMQPGDAYQDDIMGLLADLESLLPDKK